ncbi:MAG: hypothetical protein EBY32_14055 [Proteobacteria bacterium]|nr:hypothetical protein [Pseudomonadota bacterium]
MLIKGGAALSKVFGIIRRFSEDIDLSVSPATLPTSISSSCITNNDNTRT